MTAPRDVRPHGPARTLLSRAVVLTTLAGLPVVAGAAVLDGAAGALGALVGVVLVVAFLLVGQVPVAAAARGRRWSAAALLLLLYAGRVLLLVAGYLVVVNVDTGLDRRWLGLSVIVSALAWTAGTVWSAVRWRPYVVEPAPRDAD